MENTVFMFVYTVYLYEEGSFLGNGRNTKSSKGILKLFLKLFLKQFLFYRWNRFNTQKLRTDVWGCFDKRRLIFKILSRVYINSL